MRLIFIILSVSIIYSCGSENKEKQQKNDDTTTSEPIKTDSLEYVETSLGDNIFLGFYSEMSEEFYKKTLEDEFENGNLYYDENSNQYYYKIYFNDSLYDGFLIENHKEYLELKFSRWTSNFGKEFLPKNFYAKKDLSNVEKWHRSQKALKLERDYARKKKKNYISLFSSKYSKIEMVGNRFPSDIFYFSNNNKIIEVRYFLKENGDSLEGQSLISEETKHLKPKYYKPSIDLKIRYFSLDNFNSYKKEIQEKSKIYLDSLSNVKKNLNQKNNDFQKMKKQSQDNL